MPRPYSRGRRVNELNDRIGLSLVKAVAAKRVLGKQLGLGRLDVNVEAFKEPAVLLATLESDASAHLVVVLVDHGVSQAGADSDDDRLRRSAGSLDTHGVGEGWKLLIGIEDADDVATVLFDIARNTLVILKSALFRGSVHKA